MKTLFRGNDGCFIALGDEKPSALMKALLPFAVPESMVGGIAKSGQTYCRFDLRDGLPYQKLHLRVVFFGRVYPVTIGALNVNGVWVLDDEEVVPFSSNQLVHAFGVGANGKPVGFPRFHKRLGEVPNCRWCPFWTKDAVGDESECAMLGWQPTGLHYLNETQCSTEERQRHGMKLLKVFDRFGNGMTLLGAAVMRRIDEVKNIEPGVKTAPTSTVTPEERAAQQATLLKLSAYVLEMDSRLADVGCQVPLFNIPEATLRSLLDGCNGLKEAADVVNLVDGIPEGEALELALEEVRANDLEMEIESIDWALDHNLV